MLIGTGPVFRISNLGPLPVREQMSLRHISGQSITTSNKEMKHTLYIVQTGIYQNTNKTTKIKMDKRTVKDMYEKMVNDFETNCVNGRRFLREVKAQNDSAMISRINNQYFLREISHVES